MGDVEWTHLVASFEHCYGVQNEADRCSGDRTRDEIALTGQLD